jgi:protein TonB
MLDQLIESKNHSGENHRRSGFLLTTFTAVFSALTFALIYSLFSYNLAMANDKLDISTLVAPPNIPADAPPPPITEPKQRNAGKTTDKLPSREENIQRVEEVPVKALTEISTTQNPKLSRPNGGFIIGRDFNPSASGNHITGRNSGDEGSSIGIGASDENSKVIDTTPPPIIKKPEIKPAPQKTVIQTGGVVNGKATDLVKPLYPAEAKAVGAKGTVNVQVMIDENGNVVSASAVSGHQLLRRTAERAAKASKFSPTFLSNQKVKVTGVIVYNFVAQ